MATTTKITLMSRMAPRTWLLPSTACLNITGPCILATFFFSSELWLCSVVLTGSGSSQNDLNGFSFSCLNRNLPDNLLWSWQHTCTWNQGLKQCKDCQGGRHLPWLLPCCVAFCLQLSCTAYVYPPNRKWGPLRMLPSFQPSSFWALFLESSGLLAKSSCPPTPPSGGS